MKKHPLFYFLEDYLNNPDQQIVISPVKKGNVLITVTKPLSERTSIHEALELNANVDFTLKKRDGKKVLQALSCKHSVPLALNGTTGNLLDTPLNRKSDTSIPERE